MLSGEACGEASDSSDRPVRKQENVLKDFPFFFVTRSAARVQAHVRYTAKGIHTDTHENINRKEGRRREEEQVCESA